MSSPNSGEKIDLTLYRYRNPSQRLVWATQRIGYASWSSALTNRSDEEIRNVFDPGDIANAEKIRTRMKSKTGKFVGILAVMDKHLVGYAWGADDVGSVSKPRQVARRAGYLIAGKEPYAWTAQIGVLPGPEEDIDDDSKGYQGLGIGTIMLRELNAQFRRRQKPTAYVFDENRAALNWFLERGYREHPYCCPDPNPSMYGPDMYFGAGADHVRQWRLEARSVEAVLAATSERSDLLTYELIDMQHSG